MLTQKITFKISICTPFSRTEYCLICKTSTQQTEDSTSVATKEEILIFNSAVQISIAVDVHWCLRYKRWVLGCLVYAVRARARVCVCCVCARTKFKESAEEVCYFTFQIKSVATTARTAVR